ncbi:ABC transporter substrate-binding protein [Paraoerskovia marina]|uniref:Amino acid ABC transporter substrate-binding protein, PAAT family n=1 Tax=Paraoerskovia marina TaxID=545619 RepID=A0A1H1NMD6_9CELL|nr:ABC transporter substrate-binding protein [Paraoerskovia marina]SDS00152.1 amino acid ABC transporter substrate-binding protein, PAAT family [Paraoerskovia marina]
MTSHPAQHPPGPARRPTSGLRIAGVLTVTALVAAGCTQVSDEEIIGESGGVTIPEVDVSTIQPDPDVVALVPDDVAAGGLLTVGVDGAYAPAEFLAEDGQTPIGYDLDIIAAVAAVMGLESAPEIADFTSIIPSVGSTYDVGISSFTITPERLEAVTMINYFNAGESYTVLAGNPREIDPDHLCGTTVAVQVGTVQNEEIPVISDECVAAGDPEITILPFNQQNEVTTNLVGGRADVMYTDSPIAAFAVARTGGRLEQLGSVRAEADQGIVVELGDDDLALAIQAALESLDASGDYERILTAWGNEQGAVDSFDIQPEIS